MVYALIALGYTMVYGVLQLINFAHGEVFMVGAFLALTVIGILQSWQSQLSLWMILPLVFIFPCWARRFWVLSSKKWRIGLCAVRPNWRHSSVPSAFPFFYKTP